MALQEELEQITSTFKTFTTNQGTNTLEKHLKEILTDEHVKYFDILIGYFRMSGFNKINDYLDNIDEVRILIGINTENKVFEATELINQFAKEQIEDWEQAIDEERYKSIFSILELLKINKLKIKVSPNNDNHSKLYILRNKNELSGRLTGGVIIGSSNLTHNGLSGNFEINTELRQDADIEEATKLFNVLWDNAEELTLKDVEDKIIPKLKNYPPKPIEITQDNITPYQLYIKALQVYFDKRVDLIDFCDDDMPKDFKPFNYQLDAVQDGISKLNKYNGFYLADVVGLGKTIVSILIIKKLKLHTLIIAPKSVLNQWLKAIKDFKIKNIECISKDSIPSSTTAKLIIIDEAHNFRNNDTHRYEKLETICKHPCQKKVMLLSATPQNNEPNDIANQLYLFQNQNNSTIPNLLKLKSFFDKQNTKYSLIISKNNKATKEENKKALDKISQEIKENVLKYIMTRRTRTDIENWKMYSSDVKSFPKLEDFTPLIYTLEDEDLIEKYNITATYLQGGKEGLQYAKFKSLNQLNGEGRAKYKMINPRISDNIFDENPLAELMKNQLVKRFESSFEAFKISMERHTKRLDKFIENFNKNIIYLGDRSNEFLDDTKSKFRIVDDKVQYDVLTQFGKLKETRELKGHIFRQEDFQKEFKDLLEIDLILFNKLNNQWKDEKRDPKIDIFKEKLIQYENNTQKVVIFTESQDTGKYLYKNLLSKKLKILYIDSTNRDEYIDIIAQNFDANIDKEQQKNDYNIIITTDTLAEGINLHRSNTIYNYDIPWNATKLMQRIGRINRIGSTEKTYNVFNFKPVAKSEEIIGLSHKAHTKLQSFHSTYGEDNKIYTAEENVETKELFEIIKLQKDEIDEELIFLQELRTYKDKNPKEYLMIQNLSEDIQMSIKDNCNAYGYKKGDTTHKFYCIDDEVKEIDFLTFASGLKQLSTDSKIKLDDKQIEMIQNDINRYYQVNTIEKIQMQHNDTQNSANDGYAIRILKDYVRKGIINKDLFKSSKELISDGVYGKLSKEIIDSTTENIFEILTTKRITSPNNSNQQKSIEDIKFILTCTKDI